MAHPSDEETICAISTPLGNGGIGVIRLSGTKAITIGDRVFQSSQNIFLQDAPTHRIFYGKILDPRSKVILDEVIVSLMRAPKSYTAEDVLEFSCHGNLRSLRKILTLLIQEGAREALPGEFTKRAFLNGRIDLVQAEAVMDLISAESEAGRRQALKNLSGKFSKIISELRDELIALLVKVEANIDFSEEEIEVVSAEEGERAVQNLIDKVETLLKTVPDGRIARDGYQVALAGRPNVGKSSLLNRLLEKDRAIVTPFAGTTRDMLEESIMLRGLMIRLVDTAGIRSTLDQAEKEGIRRTEELLHQADLVLWVIDASMGWTEEDDKEIDKIRKKNYLILINKIDLISDTPCIDKRGIPKEKVLMISTLANRGIKELEERMVEEARRTERPLSEEESVVFKGRHENQLKEAKRSLLQALDSINRQMSHEFVALDLKGAADALAEILGISAPEELLDRIFKEFCIGK
ncbi:MAG: tRNA uridine-5-carboxymethylaminomethyl(34) synthesis GTPase MnmE [Nitrospirae bacterium]|nr:tRNA uridine-5-carboxymethylaminomethyl(34) synthesis GTPase MnmE [Nitrospirota bacterium]MBI3594263.1 tRNA uridine-5-carboxymethylaminomethyl(34) synthesis GTPase MnmE [Nitrospirota bacterium]